MRSRVLGLLAMADDDPFKDFKEGFRAIAHLFGWIGAIVIIVAAFGLATFLLSRYYKGRPKV